MKHFVLCEIRYPLPADLATTAIATAEERRILAFVQCWKPDAKFSEQLCQLVFYCALENKLTKLLCEYCIRFADASTSAGAAAKD